jgi:hypothetical protein
MGCNTFQGFLFSAPLTVGDMAALLAAADEEPDGHGVPAVA